MTESASGNATEYFRIQGISSGAVFTHFKSQPSGVSTWDGSCGTVTAQLIFEKRERRSSARNRERHEAKAREMKIERTASAAAGSARHSTTRPSLPTPSHLPGRGHGPGVARSSREGERAAALPLSPAAPPLPPGPARQSAARPRPSAGGTAGCGEKAQPHPAVTRRFPGTVGGRGRRGPPAGTRPAGSAKSGPPSSPGPASARSGLHDTAGSGAGAGPWPRSERLGPARQRRAVRRRGEGRARRPCRAQCLSAGPRPRPAGRSSHLLGSRGHGAEGKGARGSARRRLLRAGGGGGGRGSRGGLAEDAGRGASR